MKNRRYFFILLLLALELFLTSCVSLSGGQSDGGLLKNWDTVNRTLDFYKKKSVDEVLADFGDNYEAGEKFYTFYSPSGESSVTFAVKKEKIKGYSYEGSYADIQAYLAPLPSMNQGKIQAAADAWLGYSPEEIKNTFGSRVFKSTDKIICVGVNDEVCVEYSIATYTPPSASSTGGTQSASKQYIKKATVKGTYDELKEYLLPVPQESIPVKNVKQKN